MARNIFNVIELAEEKRLSVVAEVGRNHVAEMKILLEKGFGENVKISTLNKEIIGEYDYGIIFDE